LRVAKRAEDLVKTGILPNRPMKTSRIITATFLVSVIAAILAIGIRRTRQVIAPPFRPVFIAPTRSDPRPMLQVSCCSEMEEITFIRVMGTVKNLSSSPLSNLIAEARFFDSQDREIASTRGFLSRPVMMPGSVLRFELHTPVDVRIAWFTVEVRYPGGGAVPASYRPPSPFENPSDFSDDES